MEPYVTEFSASEGEDMAMEVDEPSKSNLITDYLTKQLQVKIFRTNLLIKNFLINDVKMLSLILGVEGACKPAEDRIKCFTNNVTQNCR